MIPSNRFDSRALLAVTAIVMAASLWVLIHRQFDVDELEHAHAAWSVAGGAVPYRDFFEHHTPALHLLFAPLFRVLAPDTGIDAAARTLASCRAAMWLFAAIALMLTYRIAELWDASRGSIRGVLSVALLATSFQFLNTAIEFRPDVPALVCVLTALACLFESEHAERSGQLRWHVAAGVAFGASLMFTQKTIFAAPGLLVGAVATRRWQAVAGLLIGALLPVVAVGSWFATHDTLAVFIDDTFTRNAAINADRRSPLSGLLASGLRNLPLYASGLAGAVVALRAGHRGARAALLVTLGSLAAGVAIIGRVYDQYYLLMLPLLAVFGAAAIAESTARHALSRFLATAVVAAAVALLVMVATMRYQSNDQQLADMRLVMDRVPPMDSVLSGVPGAGTFRPHAWYYFFLVGPFAHDQDYAALRSALEDERIRPRLVIFDAAVQAMPPGVLNYLRAHYQRVGGDFYIRHD